MLAVKPVTEAVIAVLVAPVAWVGLIVATVPPPLLTVADEVAYLIVIEDVDAPFAFTVAFNVALERNTEVAGSVDTVGADAGSVRKDRIWPVA